MRLRFVDSVYKVYQRSGNILLKADRSQDLPKRYEKLSKNKSAYKVEDSVLHRIRYIASEWPNAMSEGNQPANYGMVPPVQVKGMTVLSKEAFTKKVSIPGIKIARKNLGKTEKIWKSRQLKVRGIKSVASLGDSDPLRESHCLLLMDPHRLEVKPLTDTDWVALGLGPGHTMQHFEIEFAYDNWSVPDIMRAVLPDNTENVSSFSTIGHIAHFNLKDWALPYKTLIGEIVLDKVPSVKTVVNKLNQIDNTFRNFQMELLAGEESYVATTREHDCVFQLDFSKVYWNPRLATEHTKLVTSFKHDSFVYDVFAGVGPFAIPLGRKKSCTVYANDLNPSSFEYLQKNVTLNRMKGYGCVHCSNLDGREFIKTVVKNHLTERILGIVEPEDSSSCRESPSGEGTDNAAAQPQASAYVIMNLPGLAVDFLDAFPSLLGDLPHSHQLPAVSSQWQCVLPTVYCYSFTSSQEDMRQDIQTRAEAALRSPLPADFHVRYVRNVAPKKEMVCLSFRLTPELVLLQQGGDYESEHQTDGDVEPTIKRQRLAE